MRPNLVLAVSAAALLLGAGSLAGQASPGPGWLSQLPADARRGNREHCLQGDWELIQTSSNVQARRITFDDGVALARMNDPSVGEINLRAAYALIPGSGSTPDYLQVSQHAGSVERNRQLVRPPRIDRNARRIRYLTNNVLSYDEPTGTVTYRKIRPVRHYATVHLNGTHRLVPGLTPGHVFLELRSVNWPSGGRVESYGTYGFYPREIGAPSAERGPGVVHTLSTEPRLASGPRLFEAQHSITFELSDEDLVRITEAVVAWMRAQPAYDLRRGPNSMTFVREMLRTAREPALRLETMVRVYQDPDPSVSMPTSFYSNLRDTNRDRVLTWEQVMSNAGYTPCLPWK